MAGKLYSIRLNEKEQGQLKVCKEEGLGLIDIVRAGLEQYRKMKVPVPEVIQQLTGFNTYGCGCSKVEAQVLCSKHNRI